MWIYVNLQINSKLVISDSGTITEESSILNLPAVTIRNMHERPEGMDNGTLIMTGLNKQDVLNSIKVTLKQHNQSVRKFPLVEDYNVEMVSGKILRIVLSYIGYVNRTVWKK